MGSKKKIVVTGPESTGKTELAKNLASYFGSAWVPEYAREYIEKRNGKYSFSDVENIAREQLNSVCMYEKKEKKILFIDTYLIIIKVWFEYVYKCIPIWLHNEILRSKIDLFLVCDTDIPWVYDPIRENGGEMRETLLNSYIEELKFYHFPYEIVRGNGKERIKNALKHIQKHQKKV